MRYVRGFFAIVVAVAVIVPSLSFADVKITLKNGRTMTADSCQASDDKLVCFKMGGTFDLENKEVAEVKEISVQRRMKEDLPPQTQAPAEAAGQEKKGETGDGAVKKGEAAPAEAMAVDPETQRQIDRINQRKKDLGAEREKLVKERQKLQEDLKNAQMKVYKEQFIEMRKRSAELDERINRFNEEANRLNEEEKKLLEGMKAGKQ